MKQIPNLFTLLNLVAGVLAIIFILQTGETLLMLDSGESWVANLPEKIWWGAICIGVAALIDFLDGFVARLFKASSEMGKQLDSLADVVSFGVAPGLIFYQLLRISYIQEESGLDTPILYLLPALIFPCAGAWRLARFNVEQSTQTGFSGVPIPAAGLVVASLPIILWYNPFNLQAILLNKWMLYGIILTLSYLMVSRLPLLALKFTDFSIKTLMPFLILLAVVIVSIILAGWLVIPLTFVAYIIVSLLFQPTINK